MFWPRGIWASLAGYVRCGIPLKGEEFCTSASWSLCVASCLAPSFKGSSLSRRPSKRHTLPLPTTQTITRKDTRNIATYQTSNNTPQIENGPEPCKILPLLRLERIAQHDRPLRRPQQCRTHPQQRPSKDVKPAHIRMLASQETDGVDAVAEPAEGESYLDAEPVHEGAGEETDHREGAVEGYVLGDGLAQRVFGS